MQSKITFYGGAGAVTGSNFMLDSGAAKFLIDCGLRQGRDEDADKNWEPFGYDPKTVSHLIITHAHLDHIGRIPKLVKDGFVGTIISTPATKALADPLLRDALEILAHDAKRTGREPLYEEHDIDAALKLWQTHDYHQTVGLPDGVTLTLLDSGHILGSAMARFERGGRVLVVTGDLGGGNSPLLQKTEEPLGAHYVVMESVYGDRTRPEDKNRREMLENMIENSATRGGTLLIPAFSTERTQDLLFEIRGLMVEKRVPQMPVYVDSPLAEKITAVFVEYLAKGDVFTFPNMHFVEHAEDSAKLLSKPDPKLILAGSGMGSGGRIVAHFGHILPDPKSTVLIAGYQAAGTIGRRLIEGEKKIKIRGQMVAVNCHVEANYGYSAHMDGEQLLEFVNKASSNIEQVFVVEGEPAAASFLAQRIRDYLGLKATTPEAGESVTINF
ncbi:MAG: MBL fold metallo-hydrolase [Patescibacteria group bacterium]